MAWTDNNLEFLDEMKKRLSTEERSALDGHLLRTLSAHVNDEIWTNAVAAAYESVEAAKRRT
ncbi:hypothetical protein [Pseudarthrobacter sp. J47]|uniref:hypothetical protein n=1 Tax=Pseudarthrobacter sp. J47 TaxID=3116482 RepID=UPI002E80A745|nr:hypothetical protein [Pseudarthrobacter sp. J47]MEE2524523.1 hypothetical protein [Pseudarthrobacter sp. J47]